ncbi:peptide chain release factor 3 [Paenibacillus sp. YYML68]|uniref:peptide chain release factor 3 n=1 Tax=Paenibacillus sp. YYML68 TaxID=2909250 RepID=UPI002492659D|nr:peptide chain release factor 3 [Paenibacillus sp. YYML68]
MSTDISKKLSEEVQKRRTFAIISHPDAGKTTLTEKLLLFGGAIRLAGTVKGRKASRHATSDWMEIEKQRGISVTSSVMQFDYNGHRVNILDTPGHQDFSEDTYRTLTAADSAVMLIDSAKGVEAQTKKLFQVCRMRGIPIFTFINKLDREGRNPFELLEELENLLGIRSYPMNWPIGMGKQFCGVYDRKLTQVELFQGDDHREIKVKKVSGYEDPIVKEIAGEFFYDQLVQDLELLDVAGDEFDYEKVRTGELTPVFFGSAINNFGVQTFLENFLQLAPAPTSRKTSDGSIIEPLNEKFTGYVFKIQANMNPAHRDRLAFLRICSGKFERGMSVKHVRAGKDIKLSQPQQFLAQDRDIVDEAFPGDIIGLFDPGIFRIGDTLSQAGVLEFDELPTFSPELFSKVTVKNALKHKQFQKGVDQLTEEGTIQVFKTIGFEDLILGVVGQLQFEVFEYRMKGEYGVDVQLSRMTYQFARWLVGDDIDPSKFRINSQLVKDKNDNYVALFENEYALRTSTEKNPTLKFLETAP